MYIYAQYAYQPSSLSICLSVSLTRSLSHCVSLCLSVAHIEQFRRFPEPVWALAAVDRTGGGGAKARAGGMARGVARAIPTSRAEVTQAAPGQRLVEDTERVGEDGGGKLSSSRTATPTLLRRVNMQEAAAHLLLRGLYFSMELRLELPSLPPTAYSQPSMATRSWVLL